jgi:hypothetical protein
VTSRRFANWIANCWAMRIVTFPSTLGMALYILDSLITWDSVVEHAIAEIARIPIRKIIFILLIN